MTPPVMPPMAPEEEAARGASTVTEARLSAAEAMIWSRLDWAAAGEAGVALAFLALAVAWAAAAAAVGGP
jgi:hypothetical protein